MRRALLFLLSCCLSCGGELPVGGKARPSGDAPPLGEVQQGIATYYDFASGDGACMFGPSPDDLDVAAMNAEQWDGSRVCGACARVTGPAGQVVVRIVDLCPECRTGSEGRLRPRPETDDIISTRRTCRSLRCWPA
jgi:expansin (peptidoglycan-binding protein)